MIENNRANWKGIRLGVDGTVVKYFTSWTDTVKHQVFTVPAGHTYFITYAQLKVKGTSSDDCSFYVENASSVILINLISIEYTGSGKYESARQCFFPFIQVNAGEIITVGALALSDYREISMQYFDETIMVGS